MNDENDFDGALHFNDMEQLDCLDHERQADTDLYEANSE